MPNQVVSEPRLQECETSASFWATEIGRYADLMRKRADNYSIASALLSALTGLGVWSTLAASTQWPVVLLVSLVALVAAAVAAIPRIKGYGECAQAAALLGPRYGHAVGELRDVLGMLQSRNPDAGARAAQAVKEFEDVRAAKEALKPYPAELQRRINGMRTGKEPAPTTRTHGA
jgi:hypothetical protein